MPKGGVYALGEQIPRLAQDVFVAPGANIAGDVEIGAASSIWFNCVVRGDVNVIRIGARTNIQDGSIVHVTRVKHPTIIGDEVLIGHMAMIHGCTLKDRAFVGMSAIVMDGAVIEEDGMLAAGALLAPGKSVGKGELWVGRPAKFARMVREDELAYTRESIVNYCKLAQHYRNALQALD